MMDLEVIRHVRNGVCAVGYLTVTLEKYKSNIQSPFFQVVGTGFLVRDTTVITNRHVIQELNHAQANIGFPNSQFFLSFVVPSEESKLQVTIRMIRNFATLRDETLDVGFLEFDVVQETHFQNISPLNISVSSGLKVTEEVAVCGYPYGNAMLKRNSKIYRWGPVIQQGFVSAISPFDTTEAPDEILLDVRIAEGMSGAPIFRSSTGDVIGILHSGWEATTALGLPLTQERVLDWLSSYDREGNQGQQLQNENHR